MIVGHCDKPATLQFRMGTREIVETERGRFPITNRSQLITFKVMKPGIPTRAIKTRQGSNGRLLSFCDTAVEAEKLGISVEELDQWFRKHPSWNERMIAVSDETTDVVGDEGYGDAITATGNGSYHCTVCDKFLRDGRGVPNHITSKAHQEALASLRGESIAATA